MRVQEATPEQSREPEIRSSVELDSPTAYLVAVGDSGATVIDDAEIVSYSDEGTELHRLGVTSPAVEEQELPYAPVTADQPHHMTWFAGRHLVLFSPTELEVQHSFDDAVGTGVAAGGRLLVPVVEGIAVGNWETGETENTIPVDRGDHVGMVILGVAGETVVEKRGDRLYGLR